jgi:hypothetical protein
MGGIKLYTLASPSHLQLLTDYFTPSVNRIGEYDLHVMTCKQYGSSNYGTSGFNSAMYQKLKLLHEMAQLPDKYALYSDCDMVFLRETAQDLIDRIGDKDALFQWDRTELCAGFIFMRPSDKVSAYFEHCLKNMNPEKEGDQAPINRYSDMIMHDTLPMEYFNISFTQGARLYHKGDTVDIPTGIRIFHANWTIGVENKEELLKLALNNHDTAH